MQSPKLVPELLVSNLEQSLAFYTDQLGFIIIYTQSEEGFAYLNHNGAELMLDQLDRGRSWLTDELVQPFGRSVNFQIAVEDVAALRKNCRAEQIFLELETKWYRANDIEYGCYQFIAKDPDGYLIRLEQHIGTKAIRHINTNDGVASG